MLKLTGIEDVTYESISALLFNSDFHQYKTKKQSAIIKQVLSNRTSKNIQSMKLNKAIELKRNTKCGYQGIVNIDLKSHSEQGQSSTVEKHKNQFFIKLKTGFIFNQNQVILMISDFSDQRKAVLLEEVNNFKSMMMSVITRELKTPLNSIIGLNICAMEQLGRKSLTATKYLKPIMSCSQFLLILIDDILDYSRSRFHTFTLNISEVDIRSLIAKVTEVFELNSEIRGVGIKTEIDKDVPKMIRTDSNRVRQILFNLLSNAMKFTYNGHITIKISTKSIGLY